MQPESLGILIAFLHALTWAGTTIMLRSLSTKMDVYLINGVRTFVAMFVILPLVVLTGGIGDYQLLTPFRILLLSGSVVLGGVFGDAFYMSSLRLLGVNRAFPISNTFPLFTVLFSVLFLGEQVGWAMIAGAVLTLLGVGIVARAKGAAVEVDGSPLSSSRLVKGSLLALATAVVWGIATVAISVGAEGINSAVATSVRVPVVALLSSLAAARGGGLRRLRSLDRHTIGSLVLAGVLGWGIGATLFTASVQLAGPSKAAVIGTLAPLFGVPLAKIFLHERPTRHVLVGTLLTIAGIILVI